MFYTSFDYYKLDNTFAFRIFFIYYFYLLLYQ